MREHPIMQAFLFCLHNRGGHRTGKPVMRDRPQLVIIPEKSILLFSLRLQSYTTNTTFVRLTAIISMLDELTKGNLHIFLHEMAVPYTL